MLFMSGGSSFILERTNLGKISVSPHTILAKKP